LIPDIAAKAVKNYLFVSAIQCYRATDIFLPLSRQIINDIFGKLCQIVNEWIEIHAKDHVSSVADIRKELF
jgi:hypothetical protein